MTMPVTIRNKKVLKSISNKMTFDNIFCMFSLNHLIIVFFSAKKLVLSFWDFFSILKILIIKSVVTLFLLLFVCLSFLFEYSNFVFLLWLGLGEGANFTPLTPYLFICVCGCVSVCVLSTYKVRLLY